MLERLQGTWIHGNCVTWGSSVPPTSIIIPFPTPGNDGWKFGSDQVQVLFKMETVLAQENFIVGNGNEIVVTFEVVHFSLLFDNNVTIYSESQLLSILYC
jgi:hypothetical protein